MNDLRLALRGLRRQPAFSSMVVLILAAGISGSACIFAVVSALVLQPLPYHEPDRLVHLQASVPKRGIPTFALSTAEYLDYREQATVFEDMGGYQGPTETLNLKGGDEPERLAGQRVTASLFSVLGVKAAVGRIFAPTEEGPASEKVIVLSDALWRRRFGSSPSVIGQRLVLDETPYTVIGVLAEDVVFDSERADIWLPLEFDLAAEPRRRRRFRAVGRLREGVTLTEARAETQAIARRLQQEYPDSNTDFEARVVPLYEHIFGENFARTWTVGLASALFLFVIACANVGSLLLTRATARQREFLMRAALGASRFQVWKHFLADGVLLGGLGSVSAVGVSYFVGMPLVSALVPPELP